MGTDIRADISRKNPYWINKHRYYELKHFCLQYNDWQREIHELRSSVCSASVLSISGRTNISDPTPETVERIGRYSDCIYLVDNAAKLTDPTLDRYLLIGVTQEVSWTYLHMRCGIPCSREVYYVLYRKFFWILNMTHKVKR